jgi:hypothetical protein
MEVCMKIIIPFCKSKHGIYIRLASGTSKPGPWQKPFERFQIFIYYFYFANMQTFSVNHPGTLSRALMVVALFLNLKASAQDSTEARISAIRAEYQKTNSMTLKKVRFEATGESSEGADAARYYAGDSLRKIVADYAGHMGHQTSEYYFSAGKLFFVYTVDYYYDGYMTGRIKRKEENRYYFHNGRLIRWLDEKGKIKDKSLYAAKASEILNDEDLK